MGCQLSEGPLSGTVIMCACHGSQFDVTTGVVVRGPAWMPLETYTVVKQGDALELTLVVYEEPATSELAADKAAASAPAARQVQAPAPRPSATAGPPAEPAAAIGALSQVPMFAGLGAETIDNLQAFTFRRSFKIGDLIVEEGRTGNGLYVVLKGRVEVVKGLPQGRPQVVATLGAGEPFGEMALLGEWPRTASVRALEETECLGMDRWVFMHQVRRDPELGLKMLQIMAERLARTDERIME
jgi:hypothetical protein